LLSVKLIFKIVLIFSLVYVGLHVTSCRKDKFNTDSATKLQFSQDSILFDTVFTSIGSSTRNFRIRNKSTQRIKISSIVLEGGASSAFKLNVDGLPGTSFNDLELAGNDSMYVFVQVKIDPNNANSPLIVSDNIRFLVNGNEQKMPLEAWGQDAYYHRPDSAVRFEDGSYFPYSVANAVPQSYTMSGNEIVWKNDKPHVIYGYFVIDEFQKLRIPAGTKVYLNYKAGIWVFAGGQLQVLGEKNKEVLFQGARREKEFTDDPGQWDRIWINEGSDQNIINYAIIKNGFIGIQAETIGDTNHVSKRQLTLTNTKIQNMSMWGLYTVAYRVFAGNTVISNCQEHSLNVTLGGTYSFIHCTFANYWNSLKGKVRDKPTIKLNNHNSVQVIPLGLYMGNCIVDGKLANELQIDIKDDVLYPSTYTISNCWIKAQVKPIDTVLYVNNKISGTGAELKYKDIETYDFELEPEEDRIKNFVHPFAERDAKILPRDIKDLPRKTSSVTAGAYELP